MILTKYILKSLINGILVVISLVIFYSCKRNTSTKTIENKTELTDTIKDILHTKLSNLENKYLGFNSPKAINHIVTIENNYFKDYKEGYSNYYGTVWRQTAEKLMMNDSISYYDFYTSQLDKKTDSLHCTLYAYEGLKAGLDNKSLNKLTSLHKEIWKKREIAGWSIGYLLVKHFNWKAYHIISENSSEFKHCNKSFLKNKTYPVWKQPAIPIEKQLILENDKEEITKLLKDNEFGWGFSEQGIHTWITRFDILKECYWAGAPSKKIDIYNDKPLFIDTSFFNYNDYSSHIIIYPPVLKNSNI